MTNKLINIFSAWKPWLVCWSLEGHQYLAVLGWARQWDQARPIPQFRYVKKYVKMINIKSKKKKIEI